MIEINLIPEELKVKEKKVSIQSTAVLFIIPVFVAVLVLLHGYLLLNNMFLGGQVRLLENRWKALEPDRKKIEDLRKEYDLSSQDIKEIQAIVSKRLSWAQKLNLLSLNLPPGIWFNEIAVSGKDFVARCSVVSLQKGELGLINQYINALKNNPVFSSDFTNLELGTVQRKTIGSYDVVDFDLLGKLK